MECAENAIYRKWNVQQFGMCQKPNVLNLECAEMKSAQNGMFRKCWFFFQKMKCAENGMCHGRRKVHECILVILAEQPGPNGRLSCLHSFKLF